MPADRDPLECGPGSFSTMKAEMPSSVRAARATRPARSPLVTHALVPLTTYSSPSRSARQRDVAGVAAGVRLGQGQRAPPFPGGQERQPPLLLLLAAVLQEQGRHHGVGVDHAGQAHPPVGQLLDHSDIGQKVEAEPAVGLGDGDAEQSEGAHLLDDLGRGSGPRVRAARRPAMTSRATNRRTVSMISCRTSSLVGWGSRPQSAQLRSVHLKNVDGRSQIREECFQWTAASDARRPRAGR